MLGQTTGVDVFYSFSYRSDRIRLIDGLDYTDLTIVSTQENSTEIFVDDQKLATLMGVSATVITEIVFS